MLAYLLFCLNFKSNCSIWPNGTCYIGKWKDGKSHGRGIQYYPNGDRYSGKFNNFIKHGLGTYHYADGKKK